MTKPTADKMPPGYRVVSIWSCNDHGELIREIPPQPGSEVCILMPGGVFAMGDSHDLAPGEKQVERYACVEEAVQDAWKLFYLQIAPGYSLARVPLTDRLVSDQVGKHELIRNKDHSQYKGSVHLVFPNGKRFKYKGETVTYESACDAIKASHHHFEGSQAQDEDDKEVPCSRIRQAAKDLLDESNRKIKTALTNPSYAPKRLEFWKLQYDLAKDTLYKLNTKAAHRKPETTPDHEDEDKARLIGLSEELLTACIAVAKCLRRDHGQPTGQSPDPLSVMLDRSAAERLILGVVAKWEGKAETKPNKAKHNNNPRVERMSISYKVHWNERKPTSEEILQVVEDFFGQAAKIDLDQTVIYVSLPGRKSEPLRRVSGITTGPQDTDRWIEVWPYMRETGLMILTRMQDEYTNVLARGLQEVFRRYWQGTVNNEN